jgi:para-nitrobenzyl esterase
VSPAVLRGRNGVLVAEKEESMSLDRRQFLVGVSSMAASSPLCCGYLFASESVSLPTAETQYGKIHGRKLGSVDGFFGIPYGGSASGANRFLPPVPPEPWTGIRDCVKARPRAIQPPGNIFTDPTIGKYFSGGRSDAAELTEQAASEDCLVPNVLTPNTEGSRPMMVYIHGGGFSSGSAALTVLSERFVAEETSF